MKKALILVDIQNDFLPGGALAAQEGDQVIPVANQLQEQFDHVLATQDWHPADHGSFAANHPDHGVGEVIQLEGLDQILWPVHCVQGSHGAEFAKGLNMEKVARVFHKGTDPEIDSYSGFFDNGHRRSTGLAEYLRELGVGHVYLAGLATDYCVKFTALDSRREGFETTVFRDACRAVNLQPGDEEAAYREMQAAGVKVE